MMDDESDPTVDAELIELSLNPEAMEDVDDDGVTAYTIASWVMQNTDAGFVIIGSPSMGVAPSGLLYPDSIGICLNDKVGVTKTVLANILQELAYQLNSDIRDIEQFMKNAGKWDKK